jgi:hypothetical protein
VAPLAELAAPAPLQPRLLGLQRLGRREQEGPVERDRLDAEIAVEAQRGGEVAQGLGQRGARIVAQRTAFDAG